MKWLSSFGLVDGNIPKGMRCPFRHVCSIAKDGHCNNDGRPEFYSQPFSCASARGYAITIYSMLTKEEKPKYHTKEKTDKMFDARVCKCMHGWTDRMCIKQEK